MVRSGLVGFIDMFRVDLSGIVSQIRSGWVGQFSLGWSGRVGHVGYIGIWFKIFHTRNLSPHSSFYEIKFGGFVPHLLKTFEIQSPSPNCPAVFQGGLEFDQKNSY